MSGADGTEFFVSISSVFEIINIIFIFDAWV